MIVDSSWPSDITSPESASESGSLLFSNIIGKSAVAAAMVVSGMAFSFSDGNGNAPDVSSCSL